MKLSDVIQMRKKQGDPVFVKSAKRMLKRMAQIKHDNPKSNGMPTSWYMDPHTGGSPNQNLRMDGVSG